MRTRGVEPFPTVEYTNMALTDDDKSEKVYQQQLERDGLREAQQKAIMERDRLARNSGSQRRSEGNAITRSSSSSSRRDTEEESKIDFEEEDDLLDPDVSEEIGEEEFIDGPAAESQETLLQSGPHRWTPATLNEYISQYRHLEGKLWIHPRTRRLYEITTVFYYPKNRCAAAYSRVMDGSQADILDRYPMRLDGKGGLVELVANFERSGGSIGVSKTPWPTSQREWYELQEQDLEWGPIIGELKQVHSINASDIANAEAEIEETPVVYTTSHNRKLMFDGLILQALPWRTTEGDPKLVVPNSLKLNVMEMYHDSRGHPGGERTKDTIALKYWWPNMATDIEAHIKSCRPCARRKAFNLQPKIDVQPYNAPSTPWQRAHIDAAGPFNPSKSGNTHIIVIKDALTRYVEAIAISALNAETAATSFIHNIVYKHGCIAQLVSDGGKEFDSKLWAQMAQLLRIKHSIVSPYAPRANGLAENHMRTMKDAIGIYCDESQKDWDEHLQGITMSYNTTVNCQTGFTPYYMMYGREARMPSEEWMTTYQESKGILPYINRLVDVLTKVWEKVGNRKFEEVDKMNKGLRPKTRLQYVGYEIGDYAMVRAIPKVSTNIWVDDSFVKLADKLQPRYSGPYKILDEITPVTYLLLINDKPKKVHASNMKPYSGRKNVLTQYEEPGYDREEGVKGIVKEPLLLSPNTGLNQMARVKFKLRNARTSKTISELKKAERDWNEREAETALRLSQQPSDIWVLEEATQLETEPTPAESQIPTSSGSGSTSLPQVESSPSGSNNEAQIEETNMLSVEETTAQDPHSVVEDEHTIIRDKSKTVGASWVSKVKKSIAAKKTSRSQILQAAGITTQELDDDPERKTRVDSWIREISSEEHQRRTKLSRTRRQMESVTMVTPSEAIGWTLQEKERAWYANPLNKSSHIDRPKSKLRKTHWKASKFSPDFVTAQDTPLTTPEAGSHRLGDRQSSIKTSSGSRSSPTTESSVEEVNCLVIEEWDSKSVASESDESTLYYGYGQSKSLSQEMIYDREHWHRFLLRLGSKLVLNDSPELPDPAAYTRWDVPSVSKLRVELDAGIPIPLGMRKVWYLLQNEVRQFRCKGLLIPTPNVNIPSRERWRNKTLEPTKLVSERVYEYLLEVAGHNKAYDTKDTKYQMSYFFPLIRGRVTISSYPTEIKTLPVAAISKSIKRKYDRWYWEVLKGAERIEPDRRHGSSFSIRVRYQYHPKDWWDAWKAPKEEWRTVLFYMKDAIDRNGHLPEPPQGWGEGPKRC